MTTLRQATDAILEYVRGHTGMACISDQIQLATPEGGLFFTVTTRPEKVNANPVPTALFVETMHIAIYATCSDPAGDVLADWSWKKLVNIDSQEAESAMAASILEADGANQVSCRFTYKMPNGGSGWAIRVFMFRNGLIWRIV